MWTALIINTAPVLVYCAKDMTVLMILKRMRIRALLGRASESESIGRLGMLLGYMHVPTRKCVLGSLKYDKSAFFRGDMLFTMDFIAV